MNSSKDIFSFLENQKYSVVLINGTTIIGYIEQTFSNGIEIGGYRIPQDKILYWSEIEEDTK